MTTQLEFDDFQDDNEDRLREMANEIQALFVDFSSELEELELDEDNSNQIISDMYKDVFGNEYL